MIFIIFVTIAQFFVNILVIMHKLWITMWINQKWLWIS
nr:MAG TPA: hypothetical protein [Caudoviricetes sp.]